ncbi:MAG: hypothetical protein ABIF77_17065, partial [bacterium]
MSDTLDRPGMRVPTVLACTAMVVSILASSMVVAGDGDAGYPGEFLRYGVSVRSMGFGMANVSLAD